MLPQGGRTRPFGGLPVRREAVLTRAHARLDIGFAKQVRTQPEWVVLPDGAHGYWFAAPHLLTFPLTDGTGSPWTHEVRTAGPTLLWTRNGGALTFRLEGIPTREEARSVAESTG